MASSLSSSFDPAPYWGVVEECLVDIHGRIAERAFRLDVQAGAVEQLERVRHDRGDTADAEHLDLSQ